MEARAEEVPGAHVERLLLHPEELGVGIWLQRLLDVLVVERIELLYAQDGDVVPLPLRAGSEKIVIDLARAEQDALRLLRRDGVVGNDALEGALGEVAQRRDRVLVAEQALRSHHHQRLAIRTDDLAAE